MNHNDDPKINLLKECCGILEGIQNDGWIVGGGISTTIPSLLARMRPFVFSPIPYEEVSTVRFRCPGCQSVNLEVLRTDGAIWDYITCDCGQHYRVVWQEGDIKTYVLQVEKQS